MFKFPDIKKHDTVSQPLTTHVKMRGFYVIVYKTDFFLPHTFFWKSIK